MVQEANFTIYVQLCVEFICVTDCCTNRKLQWLVLLLEVMLHCLEHSALHLFCYLSAMFIHTFLHPNIKLQYLLTCTNGQMLRFSVLPNK
jgi:uncharacterized membrane protein YesL